MFDSPRVWGVYVVLLVLAVPWYWQYLPGSMTNVCGLPAWVFSSIFFSATISIYTACLLLPAWPGEVIGEDEP